MIVRKNKHQRNILHYIIASIFINTENQISQKRKKLISLDMKKSDNFYKVFSNFITDEVRLRNTIKRLHTQLEDPKNFDNLLHDEILVENIKQIILEFYKKDIKLIEILTHSTKPIILSNMAKNLEIPKYKIRRNIPTLEKVGFIILNSHVDYFNNKTLEYISIFDKLKIYLDGKNISINFSINPEIVNSITVKEIFGKTMNPTIQYLR